MESPLQCLQTLVKVEKRGHLQDPVAHWNIPQVASDQRAVPDQL